MCYCTVFALLYFEFEGNFRVQAPRGGGGGVFEDAIYRRGFFALRVWEGLYLEGLIFRTLYCIWQ